MLSICYSISTKKGENIMKNTERLENKITKESEKEENEMSKAHLIALLIAIKKLAEKSSNTQDVIDFINEVLERI